MNRDEETFLSAYLDGELVAEARVQVESALAADPTLSEHLRELTAVHELVSGLPRPAAPPDLAAAVMDRIAASRRPSLLRLLIDAAPRTLAARAAIGLAAAASLLAAVTLALPTPNPGQPLVTTSPSPRPSAPGVAVGSGAVAHVYDHPTLAERDSGPDPATLRAERQHESDLNQIRRLLDSPAALKSFVVMDTVGGEASRKVGELLQNSDRREAGFARLHVSQGIVFDARHPGKAIVFAAVMDDQELARFEKDLGTTVAHFETPAASPDVLTQLADIDEGALLAGRKVADVVFPDQLPAPAYRADRDASKPRGQSSVEDPRTGLRYPGRFLPNQLEPRDATPAVTANDAPPEPDPAAAEAAVEKPDRIAAPPKQTVVLVWVATPG